VLIVASRSQLFPFQRDEVEAIRAFVERGGALWLMANHRLFVAPQQQLAEALGLPLKLNDVTVAGWPRLRLRPHPVTEGCSDLRVRNASSIGVVDPASAIVTFAADERHAFAVALDAEEATRGRVLVTSDSGFIASRDDTGQQMFEAGDNARFFTNAVDWLLRER
jgi:hypothetical protein